MTLFQVSYFILFLIINELLLVSVIYIAIVFSSFGLSYYVLIMLRLSQMVRKSSFMCGDCAGICQVEIHTSMLVSEVCMIQ